eukprot:gnl/MRDRNA2_/MRDRNA2_101722_c0_seq1.p1 gnl/MRDRNA2_/MRDRNA2_101722_c0~~gnl/MRDRNA2_/MRDRNA2_101722_c0_seq1.p1  ORF type:complete len:406 (+),score=69.24 gnl/MRDRNA2_/MRDRNA2_101722_c0_seq1:67-1284(+)
MVCVAAKGFDLSRILAAAAIVTRLDFAASSLAPLPFEYSADIDLFNQQEAVKYFEDKFYEPAEGQLKPSLSETQFEQVESLKQRALKDPVLALAAAQVLYMFAWFRPTGEIVRENIVSAAQLFEQSILTSGCHPSLPTDHWTENACDIRYMHACLLFNWLGETGNNAEVNGQYLDKARNLLEGMKQVPRYAESGKVWTSPKMLNFNSIIFTGKPSRPIWETNSLALGRWLEEMHPIFKAELEAIINDPRDLYQQLMRIDPSREHLATPGGWDTLRIVRYHHWFEVFCEAAPQTCALIRTRPEINKCKFMNVNYVRLNPGAHLKPHFGNGPRLSAHLSIIAPEPLRAGMSVGDRDLFWLEGKAIIFDDTYPHMVSHWGTQPRYVMLVWFCHPCDENNPHEQTCPET